MAELKTRPGDENVDAFLETVADERRRTETRTVMEIMREVTGEPPRMWGESIITGRSCLYLKRLDAIDLDVLRELIDRSVRHVAARYGS